MKRCRIKPWVRKAYKKRYGYFRVTISTEGKIWGHYDASDRVLPMYLGVIKDCWTTETDDGSIRFYNNGALIHTFAPSSPGEVCDEN